MEENKFGIKKFDSRLVDIKIWQTFNCIITYLLVNSIITYRFIKGNRYGIRIEKINGRK